MALWPVDRFERMMMEDPMRAMDRFGGMGDMDHWMSRRMMPYWRDADHSMLHVGNQKEVINDDKKFAVSLDVKHFKPNELKVQLDDRDLTVEGMQEVKTEHGYIKKQFVHRWSLPEDCDLDAVHTELDNHGHLSIEAPKTGHHKNSRVLPILPAPKKKKLETSNL